MIMDNRFLMKISNQKIRNQLCDFLGASLEKFKVILILFVYFLNRFSTKDCSSDLYKQP